MPKMQVATTNMSAGEFSPLLRGRTDIEKRNAAAEKLENVIVLKQGGVTKRPPTKHIGAIADSSLPARIIPFVYSRTTSYLLEFGHQTIRVWKAGVLQQVSGSPYVITTPFLWSELADIDCRQSADTMLIFHPLHPPQRLRRFGDTRWTIDDAPFDPGPLGEIGHRGSMHLTTPLLASGSGLTITSASSFFLQSDVGRTIETKDGGRATITAFTSATQVTVTIAASSMFYASGYDYPDWILTGTPKAKITPSTTGPVGSSVTLILGGSTTESAKTITGLSWATNTVTVTCSTHGYSTGNVVMISGAAPAGYNGTYSITVVDADHFTYLRTGDPGAAYEFGVANRIPSANGAGWRSSFDVGRWVDVNGGLVKITAVNSTISATGTVMRELSGTTTAESGSWTLLGSIWNAVDGYPRTGTFFQQRAWAASTTRYPQSFWGSRSGLYFDFTPGTDDDSAVYKTIESDQINPIMHLRAGVNLIALSTGGEYSVRGGVEKPITQNNAAIRPETQWGCASMRPVQVGDEMMFAQRGADVLRSMYLTQYETYAAKDISVFSEHLMRDGISIAAFQQTPSSVVWAANAIGVPVALTYNAEQNQTSFVSMSIGGTNVVVEDIATVQEGDSDVTYLLVSRTPDGYAARRHIERIDWSDWSNAFGFHDDRIELSSAGLTTWSGLSHLAGEVVSVIADGVYVGLYTVNASGQITLSRKAYQLSVGLPYSSQVWIPRPEVGTGTGTAQGQQVSTHRILARFHETIGCAIDGQELDGFRAFDASDTLDQPPALYTGLMSISATGWSNGEEPLKFEHDTPYPFTLLSVVHEFTVNAG